MARGGEPKTGLVVTLVFFILATLGLGVGTYYGFAGQNDLEKKAKEADNKFKDMQADREWYKFQSLVLQSYLGKLPADSMGDLAALRRSFDGGQLGGKASDKQQVVNLLAELDNNKDLGWDPSQNKPKKTYTDLIAQKDRDTETLRKNWEAASRDRDKNLQDLNLAREQLAASREEFEKKLQGLNVTVATDTKVYTDKIKEQQDLIDKRGAEFVKREEEIAKKKKEEDLAKAKKDKEVKDLKDQLAKRQEDHPTQVERLDTEPPKWKVQSVDRGGQTVYINLGSADNVRPQLTFRVHGVGPSGRPVEFDEVDRDGRPILSEDGRPLKSGKGSIEVVSVMGEHLSQARISRVRDPNHDPIMAGDVLTRPGWSPTLRQHVAIAGIINLTAEFDDNPSQQERHLIDFIRDLERQGIVVDSYLDLKDVAVRGKGISLKTDFLILGETPDILRNPLVREDDARMKRKQEVVRLMEKMRKEAAENGVSSISLRKFLAESGYRLPRGATGENRGRP